ncbi:MAG: DUF2156 domain-containing protein [Chloroflexi bacterium]|nr:MAG: DUF2156 domain-containing protein [Chloroflexota bacterium]
MHKKTSPNPITRRQLSHTRIRFVLALATGLIGITNMLSVFFPKLDWDMLLGTWQTDGIRGAHKLIVVAGFFLLMLTRGLLRGKSEAWCASIILLLLSASLYIVGHGQIITTQIIITLLIGLLIILLVLFARFFCAKSDPPSVWRGYIALLVGLGIVTLYTIGGFYVLYDQFEPLADNLGIDEVIFRLLTNTHLHLTHGTTAFLFGRALPLLCFSSVLYGIVTILRPVTAALFPNAQEQQQASRLAHIYGSNSIAYFALTEDKSHFFSASGQTVISYVLQRDVAVVVGDPIGPSEEMLEAIIRFENFCQEQDWTIVFWQTSDQYTSLYRRAGLRLLKIGEDAIIYPATFTLAGKAMANVRSSAKRAEKEGLHVIFSHGSFEDAQYTAQMTHISRAWLATKGQAEMGFSMGYFTTQGESEVIYALAVDSNDKVHAFVTFVPIYGRHGWGLDLMRRAEQAAPGTMELLLARTIEHLARNGAEVVSLGLAPMSNVSETQATFLESSLASLNLRFGNPEKNRSLFNFKKKFQPQWESRYLVYSSTLTLPKVGWAIYQAHYHNTSLLREGFRLLKQWLIKHYYAGRTLADFAGTAKQASTGGLLP